MKSFTPKLRVQPFPNTSRPVGLLFRNLLNNILAAMEAAVFSWWQRNENKDVKDSKLILDLLFQL